MDADVRLVHVGRMTVQIALLRGINVGGHMKVAMPDLRAMLADLGFAEPRTLLNSGNVVFDSNGPRGRELEKLLERTAADRLGLSTDFLVRCAREWAQIIASNPFPDEAAQDPGHLVVMALKGRPSEGAVDALRAAIKGRESIHVAGNNATITYPDGIGRSKLTNARIETALGTRGTARNWNTVLKLAKLADAAGD